MADHVAVLHVRSCPNLISTDSGFGVLYLICMLRSAPPPHGLPLITMQSSPASSGHMADISVRSCPTWFWSLISSRLYTGCSLRISTWFAGPAFVNMNLTVQSSQFRATDAPTAWWSVAGAFVSPADPDVSFCLHVKLGAPHALRTTPLRNQRNEVVVDHREWRKHNQNLMALCGLVLAAWGRRSRRRTRQPFEIELMTLPEI